MPEPTITKTDNFTLEDCCEFDVITKVEKRRLHQEIAALRLEIERLRAALNAAMLTPRWEDED